MKEGTGPGGMTCIGFSSATGALGAACVQPRNMEPVPLIQRQGMRKAEPMPAQPIAQKASVRADLERELSTTIMPLPSIAPTLPPAPVMPATPPMAVGMT